MLSLHPPRIARSLTKIQPSRLIYATPSNLENTSRPDHTASAKLFADALAAEQEEDIPSSSPSKVIQHLQEKPWEGEESMHDAVLRMLVDKYKPLRTGTLQSADDKLKMQAHDPNSALSVRLDSLPPLPSPSSQTPNAAKSTFSKMAKSTDPDDAKARAEKRKAKKLQEGAVRLGRAFEGSLDYRLGKMVEESASDVQTTTASGGRLSGESAQARPNPVSLRGWTSLVDDRIEKARAKGLFNNLAGRGKPLSREAEESNPFIAREEFLMNRIVQRNGVAPPWVDIQGELEKSIQSFREIIRASWIRRASRTITASWPPPPYPRTMAHITHESVSTMRDVEWEKKEEGYHNEALKEVNGLIRKHNGVSPYSVRRPYLQREPELERCYRTSVDDILKAVEASLEESSRPNNSNLRVRPEDHESGTGETVAHLLPVEFPSDEQLGGNWVVWNNKDPWHNEAHNFRANTRPHNRNFSDQSDNKA